MSTIAAPPSSSPARARRRPCRASPPGRPSARPGPPAAPAPGPSPATRSGTPAAAAAEIASSTPFSGERRASTSAYEPSPAAAVAGEGGVGQEVGQRLDALAGQAEHGHAVGGPGAGSHEAVDGGEHLAAGAADSDDGVGGGLGQRPAAVEHEARQRAPPAAARAGPAVALADPGRAEEAHVVEVQRPPARPPRGPRASPRGPISGSMLCAWATVAPSSRDGGGRPRPDPRPRAPASRRRAHAPHRTSGARRGGAGTPAASSASRCSATARSSPPSTR